ncbi:MAG: hypothetical protein J6Q51_04500 [Clostridia bacterium]|nr:hypothetical protein [Clostridia bacterium]
MAKRISKINFIIVSILVAIGIFLSVCSFDIPFGVTSDYAGFASAISKNYDIGEAQTTVFEVTPVSEELKGVSCEKMEDTVLFVSKVLSMFGYSTNQVGVQNDNMIRTEVKVSDQSQAFMSALAQRVEIIVRAEDTAEQTEFDIKSDRINYCKVAYQPSSEDSSKYAYGVLIEFDALGSKQYKELTEYAADNGETVYFYNTAGEKLASLTGIKTYITTGQTFLENTSATTEAAILNYAAQVMMGSTDVKLTVKENSVSSAYLGFNSILYVVITMLVAFVLVNVFMVVRYRDLGLISLLTNFINAILYLFLLQALPNTFFTLSLAGVIGVILGFALTIIAQVIVFEKIRNEYAKGRRIPLSFKLGFKNATLKVVDISVIPMLVSAAVYFIGFNVIKSFAVSLFMGGLLTIFSSLVLTRIFAKWYLAINSTKPGKLALKKETKDEE